MPSRVIKPINRSEENDMNAVKMLAIALIAAGSFFWNSG